MRITVQADYEIDIDAVYIFCGDECDALNMEHRPDFCFLFKEDLGREVISKGIFRCPACLAAEQEARGRDNGA